MSIAERIIVPFQGEQSYSVYVCTYCYVNTVRYMKCIPSVLFSFLKLTEIIMSCNVHLLSQTSPFP